MEKIIMDIQMYKEDNQHIIITDEMIKAAIEANMKELIKEIREEI